MTISGASSQPGEVDVLGFFTFDGKHNFIDTSNVVLNYNFVPGDRLEIDRDKSFRLFYADSITVDYQAGEAVFHSGNANNIKYNQFYNELSTALNSVYNKIRSHYLLYFLDNKDSIINDKNFIDNYLSKDDSIIVQKINMLCSKYKFSQSITSEIMSNEMETKKLALSFAYLGNFLPRLDSL
ncbi:MAG: hypothetical protein ABI091_30215, partial [Ferruginibacter sp.]